MVLMRVIILQKYRPAFLANFCCTTFLKAWLAPLLTPRGNSKRDLFLTALLKPPLKPLKKPLAMSLTLVPI